MLRSVLAFPVLAVLASLPSCRSDGDADAFLSDRAGFSQESGGHVAALYIPNRLLDLVDVVHVGAGVTAVGLGLELHPTRYARLGAAAGIDAGIGWLGRSAAPWQAAIHARATCGLMEAMAQVGKREDPWRGLWRAPKWDVGVFAEAFGLMAYLSINPDEIVDFVAGIATYDTKADDF